MTSSRAALWEHLVCLEAPVNKTDNRSNLNISFYCLYILYAFFKIFWLTEICWILYLEEWKFCIKFFRVENRIYGQSFTFFTPIYVFDWLILTARLILCLDFKKLCILYVNINAFCALTDFNSMPTHLALSYAKKLRNCIYRTIYIYIFV